MIFPASGQLFREGWRLFCVNYFWLLVLVLMASAATYADRVGAPELKEDYRVLLAFFFCLYAVTYFYYWYSFGLGLGQYGNDTKYVFVRVLVLGFWGTVWNLTLVVAIHWLDFSRTGPESYRQNVFVLQILLLLSIFFLPLLIGVGCKVGTAKNKQKEMDGTFCDKHVSQKSTK